MPRSSSAAKPHDEVFLMIVFQSHFGQPSVDTAIGSFPAGFPEPIAGPDIAHRAVRKTSRRVIFKSLKPRPASCGRDGRMAAASDEPWYSNLAASPAVRLQSPG